jgi:hypothetical protein
MIRSFVNLILEIINYELVIVLPELLNSCTHFLANFLLSRNQYLLSQNPYLRISVFLVLLCVLGLAAAAAVSIQLYLSHPHTNII